jgi:hypothetical protein
VFRWQATLILFGGAPDHHGVLDPAPMTLHRQARSLTTLWESHPRQSAHARQGSQKNPANIGNDGTENGAKWRFSEG